MIEVSGNNNLEDILNAEDVLSMLDSLLREPAPFWDGFYRDKEKDIPFFVEVPDENLISYFEDYDINPETALEIGCGNGRNAIYIARKGCQVEAIDISSEAIGWAHQNADRSNVDITFMNGSVFDIVNEKCKYDFIYDAGCLHHIAPHRRINYIELIKRSLNPGGYFGLTCFAHGQGGGAEISDWEVYRLRSLKGGQAFTEGKLRKLFEGAFDVIELRMMKEIKQPATAFGESFLWAVLFRKA